MTLMFLFWRSFLLLTFFRTLASKIAYCPSDVQFEKRVGMSFQMCVVCFLTFFWGVFFGMMAYCSLLFASLPSCPLCGARRFLYWKRMLVFDNFASFSFISLERASRMGWGMNRAHIIQTSLCASISCSYVLLVLLGLVFLLTVAK